MLTLLLPTATVLVRSFAFNFIFKQLTVISSAAGGGPGAARAHTLHRFMCYGRGVIGDGIFTLWVSGFMLALMLPNNAVFHILRL